MQVNGVHHDASEATEKLSNGNVSEALYVPVLIVGAGPVGLLQSYLLSQLGVQSLIVERYPERLGAPKAHALSPRSLEICRQFGLDVKAMRKLGTQRKDAFWVNFLTDLSGEAVGVLPYERMDAAVLEDTPEMIHNIPQPMFEQFVAEELAKKANADIRKGVSFVSLKQNSAGVSTLVEERTTGHRFSIRSDYVIACDGARSKVRDFLKIESEGESSYETMMTIHFKANLRAVVGKRVGMLHWLFDPLAAGFIIAYDLSDNAVLISNFDSDQHPVESWSEELCQKVLRGAIGTDIDPKILSYRPWLLSRKVANQYCLDRVFLAGDSAHSFPPTGGLGLNSGLADAHNLAFKIAAIYHGYGSRSLLNSYEAERRPVAEVNSRQSVKNGKQIFGLLKTLGTAGHSDLREARESLFRTIHDPTKAKDIQEGVEQQREHFDNLNLHIGYVYGDSTIPKHASIYKPCFAAGARLPHIWINLKAESVASQIQPVDLSYVEEMSESDMALRKHSILDLCAHDAFTIILPSSPRTFEQLVSSLLERYQNPMLKFNICELNKHFDLSSVHSATTFMRDSGLGAGHGLVIRPDQHILTQLTPSTSALDLIRILDEFLGYR